jgi:hypothetical protein
VRSGGIKAFRFVANRELVILVTAVLIDLKSCDEYQWIDRPLAKMEIILNIDKTVN